MAGGAWVASADRRIVVYFDRAMCEHAGVIKHMAESSSDDAGGTVHLPAGGYSARSLALVHGWCKTAAHEPDALDARSLRNMPRDIAGIADVMRTAIFLHADGILRRAIPHFQRELMRTDERGVFASFGCEPGEPTAEEEDAVLQAHPWMKDFKCVFIAPSQK